MKVSQNIGTALFIGLLFLRVPWGKFTISYKFQIILINKNFPKNVPDHKILGEPYTRDGAQTVTSAYFVMVTSYSVKKLYFFIFYF